MGAVWTDQARMEAWRRVEVAACEEMAGPTEADLEAIRSATFSVEAVNERERVTDHDMAAFVDVLAESAGPPGRWIHFGLTSSDILDTALALQLRSAGAGLERFATEIRHLQRTEVREVEEPFRAGQKGSSAMPHKRNPIVSERICGIARLLRGYAQAGVENVALWHERDISHSSAERVALPDATVLLDYAQHLAVRVVRGMTVHADRMRANLEATHGALYSQRALLALVERDRSRDEAYRIVQEAAQQAWDTGTPFRELLAAAAPELDLDAIFDPGPFVRHAKEIVDRLDALERESATTGA